MPLGLGRVGRPDWWAPKDPLADPIEVWRDTFAQWCKVPREQIVDVRFEEREGYKIVCAAYDPDIEV